MSADEGLHEEHEEHVNHEAWVIPYADLLTLLMAMFIALFAMSTVDIDKFKSLAIGFNEALGGGELDTGVFAGHEGTSLAPGSGTGGGSGVSPQQGSAVGPDRQPNANSVLEQLIQQYQDLEIEKAAERETLEGVEARIQDRAESGGFAGELSLRFEERGLVVTVVTDQVLFDEGSAAIRPDGEALLRAVGEALKAVDNPVLVEGHTDSTPIATAVYPSNWELSSGRAGSVARFFETMGIDRARLRPQGLADVFPMAPNATAEGRALNRRVEIVVQSKLVDTALRNAGLGHRRLDPPNPGLDHAGGVEDPVDEPVHEPVDSIAPRLGVR